MVSDVRVRPSKTSPLRDETLRHRPCSADTGRCADPSGEGTPPDYLPAHVGIWSARRPFMTSTSARMPNTTFPARVRSPASRSATITWRITCSTV
jgi:hypothetical protein